MYDEARVAYQRLYVLSSNMPLRERNDVNLVKEIARVRMCFYLAFINILIERIRWNDSQSVSRYTHLRN